MASGEMWEISFLFWEAYFVFMEEMLGQKREVLLPLSEGRQENGDDTQAIKEGFPELPRLHQGLQILIGGGDDPDVQLEALCPSHPFDLALLEKAKQLGLDRGADISHLVQKAGPTVGRWRDPDQFPSPSPPC